MERIIIVDLTEGSVSEYPYDIKKERDYGRGLAHRLLTEHTTLHADIYSKENAIVIASGLLAGCSSPSSGRMSIATKTAPAEVKIGNTSGNMPQLLGSLGICGLVIKGIDKKGNAIVHIKSSGVEIFHRSELENLQASDIIRQLKTSLGNDIAIMGTTFLGDRLLPLSTVFNTYSDGQPEFNCPRSIRGDVLGSKGLRAIVVSGKGFFARECENSSAVLESGKKLAGIILDNNICGKALPIYGSQTILSLLKNKKHFDEHDFSSLPQPPIAIKTAIDNSTNSDKNTNNNNQEISNNNQKTSNNNQKTDNSGKKINYGCAPMCVIGCLNRHIKTTGEIYTSPDQTELAAALEENFSIKDNEFLNRLNDRLREICLNSLSFVDEAKSYFDKNHKQATTQSIINLLEEIETGTKLGKQLGQGNSGTTDKPTSANFEQVSELNMLHYQVFLLENLGICLFAAFALVNNNAALSVLKELFNAKTGLNASEDDLIFYAKECITKEAQYLTRCGNTNAKISVPGFARVLHHYFSL